MTVDDLEARREPFDRLQDDCRVHAAYRHRSAQLEGDFRLQSRRGTSAQRKRRVVVFRVAERGVVNVGPDRRSRAVLGPDVAIGETDLAADAALAAGATQLDHFCGDVVRGAPVEGRVARGGRRDQFAVIVGVEQFSCNKRNIRQFLPLQELFNPAKTAVVISSRRVARQGARTLAQAPINAAGFTQRPRPGSFPSWPRAVVSPWRRGTRPRPTIASRAPSKETRARPRV